MRPMSKKGASYADIEALPEHLTGELFGDELFVSEDSGRKLRPPGCDRNP